MTKKDKTDRDLIIHALKEKLIICEKEKSSSLSLNEKLSKELAGQKNISANRLEDNRTKEYQLSLKEDAIDQLNAFISDKDAELNIQVRNKYLNKFF